MGEIEIRRSARRRRTVTAYRDGDRVVVLMPAHLSAAEEQQHVRRLVAKLQARDERRPTGDAELLARATALSRRHLGGAAVPRSVRWVTNQNRRWGSCTVADGSIRLSHRLQDMPAWVVDYVLVHELVHLLVPHHGPQFWERVAAYPQAERAKGFLEGVAYRR